MKTKKIIVLLLLIALVIIGLAKESNAQFIYRKLTAGLETYLGGVILKDDAYMLLVERSFPGTQARIFQPITELVIDAFGFSALGLRGEMSNLDGALIGQWRYYSPLGSKPGIGNEAPETIINDYHLVEINRKLKIGIPTKTLVECSRGWGSRKLDAVNSGIINNILKTVKVGEEVDGPIGAHYLFMRSLRTIVGFTDWSISRNVENKLAYNNYEPVFMLLANLKSILRSDHLSRGQWIEATKLDEFFNKFKLNNLVELTAKIKRDELQFPELFPAESKEAIEKLGEVLSRIIATGWHDVKKSKSKYEKSAKTFAEYACFIFNSLGYDGFANLEGDGAVKAVESLYKRVLGSKKTPPLVKTGKTQTEIMDRMNKVF